MSAVLNAKSVRILSVFTTLFILSPALAQVSDDDPTAISVNIRAASDQSTAAAVVRWTEVVLTSPGGIVSGTYGNGRNLCRDDDPVGTCTITAAKYREARRYRDQRRMDNPSLGSRLGGIIELTQPVVGVVAFAVDTDAVNRGPFSISYRASGGGKSTRTHSSRSRTDGGNPRGISWESTVDVTSSDVRARGEVEITLNVFASDGGAISDVRWSGAEFVASSASISGSYGGGRSLCSETTPARHLHRRRHGFPDAYG